MKKQKIKPEYALRDILEKYPQIDISEIETFAPVFYPIARIEADMKERSFEDFEAVQETVLKFILLGFKKEEEIAELLGLNPGYILKMMKLLLSYGHIDEKRNITELGALSLSEGRKITLEHTKQIFLMDALTCDIIKLNKDPDRTFIESTEDMEGSDKYVPILEHSYGISKDEVTGTLKEVQYNTIRLMKSTASINVVDVSDVRCLGIKYIKSYLLKLKNRFPMIFVKRYDRGGEGKARFFWLPFSVDNEGDKAFLNISDIPVNTAENRVFINDVYKRIEEKRASDRVSDEIADKISYIKESLYKINSEFNSFKTVVSSADFTGVAKGTVRLLNDFGTRGVSLIVDDDLSGEILKIYPDKNDDILKKTSELIISLSDKFTFKKMASVISEDISGNIIEEIYNKLIKLK